MLSPRGRVVRATEAPPVTPGDGVPATTRRVTRQPDRRKGGSNAAGAAPPREGARPTKGQKAQPPPKQARAVRTTRVVVRRVNPWTVLKVSLLFYLSLCMVLLIAVVLLWAAARTVGVVGNVESFISGVGFNDFRFAPGDMLRGATYAGGVLVVAGTVGNALMAVLYNLIADVVGGVKLVLAEDETASSEAPPAGHKR